MCLAQQLCHVTRVDTIVMSTREEVGLFLLDYRNQITFTMWKLGKQRIKFRDNMERVVFRFSGSKWCSG